MVPFSAASTIGKPCSRFAKMFSRTTIALSTNKPTASAIPPRDMMFKLRSVRSIRANVPITETGIVTPTINVALALPRKPYRTITANKAPNIAADLTSLTAERMNCDWSAMI